MAEARNSVMSLIGASVLMLLAAVSLVRTEESVGLILLWAALLAGGQLIRVPTTGRRSLYVGVAAAAAVPLMLREPLAVTAVYALGLLGSGAVLRARGRSEDAIGRFLVSEMFALAAYAITFFSLIGLYEMAGFTGQFAELVAIGAGALAWFMVSAFAQALLSSGEGRKALRYTWLEALSDWPAVLSLFATGSLFAFAYPVLGLWAIPIALIPYAFSHMAFVRYSGTRVTYGQTIRALSRIPEVAGLAPEGHSTRSAHLAVAIGQEVGLSPADVTELEYAALMHDIGRITLNEPAILKAGYTDQDIARWGSQIIAEAPYLHRVSEIVRQQHSPYRRPGEQSDESLPLPAKIIKVASAYDQAVSETGLPPIEAIEVLHRGAAYDFDPRVVKSLRRVMQRNGVIAY